MTEYSTLLFASPSFVEGVARLVDFGGTLNVYNTSESGNEADFRALSSDVAAVAQDFTVQIERVTREQTQSQFESNRS